MLDRLVIEVKTGVVTVKDDNNHSLNKMIEELEKRAISTRVRGRSGPIRGEHTLLICIQCLRAHCPFSEPIITGERAVIAQATYLLPGIITSHTSSRFQKARNFLARNKASQLDVRAAESCHYTVLLPFEAIVYPAFGPSARVPMEC